VSTANLRPPRRSALLGEARAALTIARMLPALVRGADRTLADHTSPTVLLPGFGTGDRAMLPLRRYLHKHGVAAEGWGLGINRAGLDLPHALEDISAGWQLAPKASYRREAGVALLCDRMAEYVSVRARALGRPVSLVGWSLGGTIAREVARDVPEAVDRVITLGSPVIGGPKYTAAAAALRSRGLDLDWIEVNVRRRDRRPITQPITSVVSRCDAVVAWEAAIDRVSPRVRLVEVDTPHIGLAFDPTVWDVVLDALAEPAR
jgi:pimeloyl-ACP methyl ester carboxylesterase